MLQKMHDEEYLLTKRDDRQYIAEEIDFYTTFDYNSLINQTDYECDYYASALLNEEITGVRPVNLLSLHGDSLDLSHAENHARQRNRRIYINMHRNDRKKYKSRCNSL